MLNRWQKPPIGAQIRLEHPLAQGLVGCWLFNEGQGNRAFDSVWRSPGSIQNPDWRPGALHVGDTSNKYVTVACSPDIEPTTLTVVAGCQVISFTERHEKVVCKPYISTKSPYQSYTLARESTLSQFCFEINVNGSLYTIELGDLVLGEDVFLAGTFDGTYVKGYQDGQLITIESHPGAIGYYGTDLYFGDNPIETSAGHPRYLDCLLYFVLLYRRALSESEISWLYEEPYAMFESYSLVKYFFITSAPTVNVPVFMQSYRRRRSA